MMPISRPMLPILLEIAQHAGEVILSIYHKSSCAISRKEDGSFLTAADTEAHVFICKALQTHYPDIPVLSEEEACPLAVRKNWSRFFLVDPLDGTREFIQRNGEFTVNIALIEAGAPQLGIIHAPALGVTYYANRHEGAYKMTPEGLVVPLPMFEKPAGELRIVTSRSHPDARTEAWLKGLTGHSDRLRMISAGSALKLGLLAEGSADLYPRMGPTMEWDIAAGHAILNETGGMILAEDTGHPLRYNKPELVNPGFVACTNTASSVLQPYHARLRDSL